MPAGTVKHVSCLGTEFAIYREENGGRAFITDAYCPHLGANLAVGGEVVGDCIKCPFHEWQFNGESGAVTSIPYAKKVLTIRSSYLRTIHSSIRRGTCAEHI